MDWIQIHEVLQDMESVAEDGKLKTFSFAFVRAAKGRGGARGSIKQVRVAAKFTRPGRKSQGETTRDWRFKDHEVIPIQDLEEDQLLTPKYTHIIEYNGQPVKHYG